MKKTKKYEGSKMDKKLDKKFGYKEGSKKDKAMDKKMANAKKPGALFNKLMAKKKK